MHLISDIFLKMNSLLLALATHLITRYTADRLFASVSQMNTGISAEKITYKLLVPVGLNCWTIMK